MSATVELSSVEFARVCANALAFLPARAMKPLARLEIRQTGQVVVTATDTYTIARDYCQGTGGDTYVATGIERDTLAAFDTAGRKDKKGRGVLRIAGDALEFLPEDDSEVEPVTVATIPLPGELWTHIDALMERLEEREPVVPEVVAFDPSLLMRFSKVKADKAERVADFYFSDHLAPALVKIGPTFTGAIMPIDRNVHAENVGSDGLWST